MAQTRQAASPKEPLSTVDPGKLFTKMQRTGQAAPGAAFFKGAFQQHPTSPPSAAASSAASDTMGCKCDWAPSGCSTPDDGTRCRKVCCGHGVQPEEEEAYQAHLGNVIDNCECAWAKAPGVCESPDDGSRCRKTCCGALTRMKAEAEARAKEKAAVRAREEAALLARQQAQDHPKPASTTPPPAATPPLATHAAPFPTNAWWENLALAPGSTKPEGNIAQMPYVVLAGMASILVMQPFYVGPAAESFSDTEALSLGAAEQLQGPYVTDWDELSLMLGWQEASGGTGMAVPLVRGSPYITAEYQGTTPKLTTPQTLREGTIVVDGKASQCNGSPLTGSTFGFDFVNSDSSWKLFVPKGTTWVCNAAPFSVTSTAPIMSAVRLALVNDCATGTGPHHCKDAFKGQDAPAYAALLEEHAGIYPVGATIDWSVAGDVGSVTWTWSTKPLEGWGSSTLLQLAWPVHMHAFSDDVRQAARKTPFWDTRGPATAVAGDSWQLSYGLFPDVGLGSPHPVAEGFRDEIVEVLRGPGSAMWNGSMPDRKFDLPLNYQLGVGDTYFSGKMIARLARLVAIADEVGESHLPYFADMVERLAKRVEVWFRPDSQTPFVYDSSWGGLLSCGCMFDDCWGKCTPHCTNRQNASARATCPALENAGMNFGNGFYNDHHFHYGYFIYSAAVVAKYRPAWEAKWRQHILAMVRDYGNPSREDPSFPVARNKDWFLGTSWAGGIQAMVNGRNQESTSESINAYYALYVYGAMVKAPFAKELKDFGRLLTAMETHGARILWHVHKGYSEVYGNDFKFPIVGILWEHAATHQTWFGAAPYLVDGIQLIPFTPAMEAYLDRDWVGEHVPTFEKECDGDAACAKTGWSWPLCLEQAVLDTKVAHACLKSLPDDAFSPNNPASNGNSLTNSLYWIATRPGARPAGDNHWTLEPLPKTTTRATTTTSTEPPTTTTAPAPPHGPLPAALTTAPSAAPTAAPTAFPTAAPTPVATTTFDLYTTPTALRVRSTTAAPDAPTNLTNTLRKKDPRSRDVVYS